MASNDSFAQYLKEATRYPLLDKSQEILLARQVQTWLHDPECHTAPEERRGNGLTRNLLSAT